VVNPGDVVAADGLCLEADELQYDKATMTGGGVYFHSVKCG
jgi:hypothetical protein